MRDARAHYIRHNESARIPERYVILDCESKRIKKGSNEVQTWALAVAKFITFTRSGQVKSTRFRYDSPEELWQAVSIFTRSKRRTVLYAHNLNYELRISRCLTLLPELEWTLQDMRLDGRGSWSRWTRQNASLLLCDSASIFPMPLERLATTLGMAKVPLPSYRQRELLFQRCEQDVEILSAAIVEYIKWLRTGVAGNWQMTGAGQSWSHFRHSCMPYPILVHDNETALEAERLAMHTGRCEAWRWGEIKRTKLYEYDFANSYPRIARDVDLPQALWGTLGPTPIKRMLDLCSRYAVLAKVTVTTDSPCVPATHAGRTLWPVGTFDTYLWDPEIRILAEANATIQVHRAWLYKRAPILKDWSKWILSTLSDRTDTVEPWKKVILKHWSRSLIGRFGMRYRAWEEFATATESRIQCSVFHNSDTGETSELLQIGTKIFKLSGYKEISDGCPQITGYIMSEARAKLWRVCLSIGEPNVYYMDTDSVVVNQAGGIHIAQQSETGDFAGLRSKSAYTSARIYGPRSAIFGGKPSVSGMAKNSTKIQPDKWKSEQWRGAKQSIARGEHDTVVVSYATFTLRYNEHRRAYSDNGYTTPYRLPEYIPTSDYVPPKSRLERSILNGYPAMLSRSTSLKRGTQFERRRKDTITL